MLFAAISTIASTYFQSKSLPCARAGKIFRPLAEYFIARFSKQAGKNIKTIDQATLELLQSYAWPGNIRELQNVIERSTILCESETFSVDEAWLSKPAPPIQAGAATLSKVPASREKEMIEAALAASGGRVSGITGAAGALGISASTLESKIRALKINKDQFKTAR